MPTRDWNTTYESIPANTDSRSEGAMRIRHLKTDVRERLEVDHYYSLTGTQSDHGEHKKITFNAPTTKPTASGTKGYLYTKTVGSRSELHYVDNAGSEVQITTSGSLNLSSIDRIQYSTSNVVVTDGYVTYTLAGSQRVKWTTSALQPITSMDLGTSGNRFVNIYASGTVYSGGIYCSGPITVTGTATFSSNASFPNVNVSQYSTATHFWGTYLTLNSVLQGQDVTAALNRKIIDIGVWNTQYTSTKNVAHGLTMTKIRSVDGVVVNDDSSYMWPLWQEISGYSITFSVGSINSTTINLTCTTGGSSFFRSNSNNRGWIIIHYVN